MRTADKFVELYKEYEAVLHDAGEETKSVEDAADSVTSNRLRMCRMFRNYLVHNADAGFIEPTPKMMAFLTAEIKRRKEAGDVVKKHLRRPSDVVVDLKAKACDVVDRMVRANVQTVAAYDGRKWMLFSLSAIAAAAVHNRLNRMYDVKPERNKPLFCSPLDKMASIDLDRFCLCTDTGDADGKVLGAVKGGLL